jgi:Tol biopolymer transport system component
MRLAPGKQLGPYEITARLGAGGMGEVYRARDTRLERTVAIKILSQLSSDPAHRQRFEREAKAISSLNHPHICVLYDIGQHDGIDYLVMECLEGETLARRLEKGPLPVDQVLKLGAQIADALDKAHRTGIVHRDLKPGNIMLTPTGAKLLDFGLAKPASSLTDLATMTATKAEPPVTEHGTIVGTFQYMSPEQIEGRELDGRSDIFSLGAVLYEMLTGQRAFDGKSQLSVASAILEKEPAPIATLKPLTPPALDHAIRACLAKDPDDRWQTARDLSHELKWIGEAGSQAGAAAVAGRGSRGVPEKVAWATAAAVLIGALVAMGVDHIKLKNVASADTVVRASIQPPPGRQFALVGFNASAPAISPDGKQLVSPVRNQETLFLWLRGLNDAGEGRMLPGTEAGTFPFWSPDGRSIGFLARGKLKRIDTDGNSLQTLCDVVGAAGGGGGAWSPDGIILFTPSPSSPLFQIPANGGTPRQITKLDTGRGETSHRWPVFLADGRHFLFFVRTLNPEMAGIYAGSLDSEDYHMVAQTALGPAFEAGGTMLYVRDGALIAQPFDERKLVTTGEPTVLPDRVEFNPRVSRALFSASRTSVLAYYPASPGGPFAVTWYDRDGNRGDPLGTGVLCCPALSPDGARAVVTIASTDGLSQDLWSFDLSRGTKTRLTSGQGNKQEAVWQPDGQFVLFNLFLLDVPHIFRIKSDGTGAMETVLETAGVSERAYSVCRDGRYLAYLRTPMGSLTSIWILPLSGDRKPFALVQSQFANLGAARFSPDCKWVAYQSNETGKYEVYITHFPDATRRYQVSTQGGTLPRWRGDGRELFYFSEPQSSMMAVNVDEKIEELSLGPPRALFHLANKAELYSPFDVTADGRRFLIAETNSPAGPLTLVMNWDSELKKK